MISLPPDVPNNGSYAAAIECSGSSPGDPAEFRILATPSFYEPADYNKDISSRRPSYTVERRDSMTLALKNVQMTLLVACF